MLKKKIKKNERIFAKNFERNYGKKMTLGTSDAWSMRGSSHQPSNSAYYIEDCRISGAEMPSFARL